MDVVFERVAPVLPVADLDAALERYRRLGFDVDLDIGPERYSFVQRGPVSMHLTERAGHDPDHSDAVVYLYVSDADALHAEWSQAGVAGELNEPFDTHYGLREFGYVDPDGTLHRVGSPLPKLCPTRLTGPSTYTRRSIRVITQPAQWSIDPVRTGALDHCAGWKSGPGAEITVKIVLDGVPDS